MERWHKMEGASKAFSALRKSLKNGELETDKPEVITAWLDKVEAEVDEALKD